MRLNFKFDINIASKKILKEQLDKLNLKYEITGFGEVEIKDNLTADKQKELNSALAVYGIEIVESQKDAFVQRIKDVIIEMVFLREEQPLEKNSAFLEEKLNQRYGYIANTFSEVTHTSIENFIILQKIERAKHLIINDGLTLTEVAYKLNYSSVAHLSTQFKKMTGLTPTAFLRIINKKRNLPQS